MKKTIAALLVTILASAGYVVLDKSASERLIAMESQVSVQQSVIESIQKSTTGTTHVCPTVTLPTEKSPEEMITGDTLRCYPKEGATLMAYYAETSTGTWHYDETTNAREEPTTAQTTAAVTTMPTTKKPMPTTTCTTARVRAQADEPTYSTAPAVTEITVTETTGTTYPPDGPTETTRKMPFADYDHYTSLEQFQIDRFTCEMIGRSPLSVPQFRVVLRAHVNPYLAAKNVRVEIGETGSTMLYLYTTVAADGSIYVTDTVRLINAQTILLQGVFIY